MLVKPFHTMSHFNTSSMRQKTFRFYTPRKSQKIFAFLTLPGGAEMEVFLKFSRGTKNGTSV